MNRALLVGINKYPNCPLRGCVNDITDMAKYLTEKCDFGLADIRLLTDGRATKKNIIDRLHWLMEAAKPGNHVVFHYSGHGVQVPTRDKKGEVDGLDEAICPVDFDWEDEHMIRDKEFHEIFKEIPHGVNFTWVSDSCHSGDLTKQFTTDHGDSRVKTFQAPVDIDWRLQTAKSKGLSRSKLSGPSDTLGLKVNLAFISGCKSNQTSADANFDSRYNGAMTYSLLRSFRSNPKKTPLCDIIKDMDDFLCKSGYSQVPMLEGANDLKDRPFIW